MCSSVFCSKVLCLIMFKYQKASYRWHIIRLFPCLSTIIGSLVHLPTQKTWKHFSARVWKKGAHQILLPPWHKKGILLKYLCLLICKFSPMAPSLSFRKRQRCTNSNAMAKVRAKHGNCSVFACTEFIHLFTVYYAAATHIWYKHVISFPAVYLHRHNCFCTSCVFLT